MHKIWRVARTEYLNAVRSKAFLMGLVMLPIFMLGGIVIPQLLKNKIDIKDRRVLVWDRSGKLAEVLERQASERNEGEIFESKGGERPQQIKPAFRFETWQPRSDEAERAEFLLSERVRRKELFAFVFVGRDALAPDGGKDDEIAYYTETPTYMDLPDWIGRVGERGDQTTATRGGEPRPRADRQADALHPDQEDGALQRGRLGRSPQSQTGKPSRHVCRAIRFDVPALHAGHVQRARLAEYRAGGEAAQDRRGARVFRHSLPTHDGETGGGKCWWVGAWPSYTWEQS